MLLIAFTFHLHGIMVLVGKIFFIVILKKISQYQKMQGFQLIVLQMLNIFSNTMIRFIFRQIELEVIILKIQHAAVTFMFHFQKRILQFLSSPLNYILRMISQMIKRGIQ
jgi:hypothetical protein